jgi:hypothetical protein
VASAGVSIASAQQGTFEVPLYEKKTLKFSKPNKPKSKYETHFKCTGNTCRCGYLADEAEEGEDIGDPANDLFDCYEMVMEGNCKSGDTFGGDMICSRNRDGRLKCRCTAKAPSGAGGVVESLETQVDNLF